MEGDADAGAIVDGYGLVVETDKADKERGVAGGLYFKATVSAGLCSNGGAPDFYVGAFEGFAFFIDDLSFDVDDLEGCHVKDGRRADDGFCRAAFDDDD